MAEVEDGKDHALVDPGSSVGRQPSSEDGYTFNAFASYATDPDGALVRDVEVFLEGLHQNPLVEPEYRRRLELCVDGSDFRLPRRPRDGASPPEDAVFALITAYLAQSRCFVLFVGPKSARHPWVNREVDWWLRNRRTDPFLVVVTHGSDPQNDRENTFPAAIRKIGLDQQIWFDFRGFVRDRTAVAVRDYDEERVRLAAALMGPDVSAQDLIKRWKQNAARDQRR